MKERKSTSTFPLFIKILISVLFGFIVTCLIGLYIQSQKIKSITQDNSTLYNQNNYLNQKILSTDKIVRKYLNIQGEICTKDLNTCVELIITRLNSKPVLPSASGGLCLIRNRAANMPSYFDPDVGKGYAKLNKEDASTLRELKESCSENDLAKLLQPYCAYNVDPVQFEVATINKFGGITSSTCSSLGCVYIECPNK
ncbi:hypothetical protein A2767_02785 [Candidatus Roizmanbacteria bacterium RIFCSPHIGHO2_01_FULL_35_10]|uniref:Uncharacterized protein n=1 Tax=Candidatus Roizmanbacteria bacterium RIFCSPLOWO2_01_FULL_35_13 TaxID=1802055 RepID=A0A1F7IF29_9BACT|nr:MAG: hypothetical protein A2767_02785 [Candidatus Roizmanbacteria bacterium RIFCSPHIGHO2_01_FULL_35_10]OGK41966.1 MAG: hypothetical protein A3A74_04685 [Candidatus Roizmanbacteria bacterium RIFCSPLOWO2_01_FULL_35_13]